MGADNTRINIFHCPGHPIYDRQGRTIHRPSLNWRRDALKEKRKMASNEKVLSPRKRAGEDSITRRGHPCVVI